MTSARRAVSARVTAPPGAGSAGLSRRGGARGATARARAMAAGLAALAALAALVAGPPVLLDKFAGSPLPRRLPGWRQVVTALSSRDDVGLVLAVVRDGTWLAWLLFTACVLAEVVAAARGRRAPRLRLGGIQGASARLVALVALAAGASAASSLPASAATVSGQHASQLQSGHARPGTRQASSKPRSVTVSEARVVTVHSGDCLWSIAQSYLGAGDLYVEIARLNYGRQMGDGQVFTNPALIMPGWRLLLPATAGTDGTGQAVAPPAGSQHPGHATREVHYQRRHPAARSVAAVPESLPAAGSDSSTRAASAELARTAAMPHSHAGEVSRAPAFATGALAGAILTALTGLRLRQRQERRRGRRIALPAGTEVLAAEQRLRATAAGTPLQTLRDALAVLELGVRAGSGELPDIVGVYVTPDALEILLAVPATDAPPAPYEVSPGRQGMCWQLALPAVVAPSTDPGACHVLPGLVTAGWIGVGCLLLDLESLQVTGCDGPAALVDQVVSTVATELAAGQWSGWYDLLLVGCDELAPLDRAQHCAGMDEALSIVAARCTRTAELIGSRAGTDVRKLRLAEPDDEDWGLTLLVSRVAPSPDQLARLLDLAVDGPGGVAVLFAGDPGTADGRMAPTALQLAPDPQVAGGVVANVVPLQITVRPSALSEADYAAVGTLFSSAADLRDVSPDDEPYSDYATPPWIPQLADRPDAAVAHGPRADLADGDGADDEPPSALRSESGAVDGPESCGAERDDDAGLQRFDGALANEPGLTVSVLGPLVISGATGPLQPKQAELVLALALAAPAGLSNSALCALLGADPDHPKPTDAVRQIIARTRRRIGMASDGAEYIIHTGSGRYMLHPEASLDWSQFRELVAAGRAEDLRAALALVRGEPFAGGYFWWIDIPLIESVRAEVVDAAERLAEDELAAGSPRASGRAARAGLLAEGSAEQLWRAVMRAEHAAGNLAGVTEAWRRCLDAIEDVAPGGEPHPDTAALYRRLTATASEPVSTG